ncbi:MAG: type I-F CRISPR-associated protein Csy3 [Thiotrichales bacterium]|jgi:CRISPR-associated protein Csy3|nr:type I-F CRISPR-associated protein Csy3 [Thiotrichales bacterium]MBT4261083.1 type I-F CRISPR-associated protein Csy3 [Thiotrichales bacterium]MBT4972387.1 type I-F CRISPR-associated protein Csy3 [Thiotrichales bacterium]
MSNKDEIKLPSMLSFERKLEASDALMYSGNWRDKGEDCRDSEADKAWSPIPITKRYNRSTQSSFGIDDTKKMEPNPVSSGSDDANLPNNHDTLKVDFSLRVIGNVGAPFACNSPKFEAAIKQEVNSFKQSDGVKELAFRYAYNIASGRFLWRNRVGAEKIRVCIAVDEKIENSLGFSAYDFSLKDFNGERDNSNLEKLANLIQKGLTSSNSEGESVLLKVSAYIKLGDGQHIFPSEEMNMSEKGKVLFQLDNCAAIHNVKIGNALRTIDNWYGDEVLIKNSQDDKKIETVTVSDEIKTPIAIEPYGAVTQRGAAYRASKIDLYTLMRNWINNKEISEDNKKYVVGCLIRGGVFGGK